MASNKMQKVAPSILTAAALLLVTSAQADMFQPRHRCSTPVKPYKFTSQWEVDNFNDEVDRYKRCIQDFLEEQDDQAQNHMAAKKTAIDDWNRFVRLELN